MSNGRSPQKTSCNDENAPITSITESVGILYEEFVSLLTSVVHLQLSSLLVDQDLTFREKKQTILKLLVREWLDHALPIFRCLHECCISTPRAGRSSDFDEDVGRQTRWVWANFYKMGLGQFLLLRRGRDCAFILYDGPCILNPQQNHHTGPAPNQAGREIAPRFFFREFLKKNMSVLSNVVRVNFIPLRTFSSLRIDVLKVCQQKRGANSLNFPIWISIMLVVDCVEDVVVDPW